MRPAVRLPAVRVTVAMTQTTSAKAVAICTAVREVAASAERP
jgi:hypothetical protein